jgi:hypothetical protein
MISLLFSNWRFVVDALLIIGLVVLVFLVNPFGIFGNGLSLGTTSNMVTEVNQIGQLVTAEYYGEVISSLDESRLVLIEEDSTQQQANRYYSEIKHALFDLYQYQLIPRKERTEEYRNRDANDKSAGNNWRRVIQHDVRRRNILEKLEYQGLLASQLGSLPNGNEDCSSQLCKVVEFLWREKYGNAEKDNWGPTKRTVEEVLFTTYNEVAENHQGSSTETFQNYLDDGFDFPANYQSFAFDDQVSRLSRVERKKKLTMVGRGWVKAGFDFQSLDENSYYFHKESGELHFFGLEPQILNADINPWFIPQRGIPGFEVIDYHGRVNFKDAQRVKQHCIDKLIAYAHRADILAQAQQQGAETLKTFFSLLTGEEVSQVHFHNDLLTQTFKEVGRDEFISYYEGVLIDSVLLQEMKITDSLRNALSNRSRNRQLADERDSLQQKALNQLLGLPFEGSEQPFNYYSVLAYRIGQDSIIDQYEQAQLLQARWDVSSEKNHHRLSTYKSPKFWYSDTLELMSQYNAALHYLNLRSAQVRTIRAKLFPQASDSIPLIEEDSSLRILDFYVQNDTAHLRYLDSLTLADKTWLKQQFHPFHYHRGLFNSIIQTGNLVDPFSAKSGTSALHRASPDTFWVYNSDSNSLLTIALPMDSLLRVGDQSPIGRFIINSEWRLLNADSTLLSPDFQFSDTIPISYRPGELAFYFEKLEKAHLREQRRGPIVKASEWFQKRLSRQESESILDQLNEFFFP